jgi:hypothetical protein
MGKYPYGILIVILANMGEVSLGFCLAFGSSAGIALRFGKNEVLPNPSHLTFQ